MELIAKSSFLREVVVSIGCEITQYSSSPTTPEEQHLLNTHDLAVDAQETLDCTQLEQRILYYISEQV